MLISNVNLFFSLLASSVMIFIAALVFFNDRKSVTNIIFFMHSLVIAAWSIINYFSLTVNLDWSLFLIRSVICLAVPHVFLFLIFVLNFPSRKLSIGKRLLCLLSFLIVLMMGLSFSRFVFKGISLINGEVVPIIGTLMPTFGVVFVLTSLFTIGLVIEKYFYSKGLVKRQWLAVGLGLLIAYFLLISLVFVQVVVFKNTFFVPYSPLFIILIFVGAAYAILKHNLLNVKLIATEIFSAILLIVSLVQVFFANNITSLIINLAVFLAILVFDILLILSMTKEVEVREELGKLAHSLEKANLRLQEIDKQKTDFLSIASHQLRTPLSIAKGYIELIEDGAYGKVPAKVTKVLDDMDESNEHLVKLVDEFLDITRIEQGRTKFNFDYRDINKLCEGVIKELKGRAHDHGLKVIWKPNKKLGKIHLDEEKVRHVVFNFIDNAIKYSEKGIITVSSEKEDKGFTVRVKDQGVGFGKEDQANFFQKFYRGKNVLGSNVTGTGLGLYVCRKFIESHGGHVWARSEGLGKGGEFGFWIPLTKKTAEKANKTVNKQ